MPAPIPRLGLGTWKNTDPATCARSVRIAIDAGYRHIDTAQLYENEEAVGDGIRAASVERDELFVATKVAPANLDYDDVLSSTRASLDRLGLRSVDLLYVHWPFDSYMAEETLQAFNELVDSGLIDAVGLSNFEPDLLDQAMDILDAPLLAHQVEVHPLNPQQALLERARSDDHWLVAYSPLGRGELLTHPTVAAVAEETAYSPAQVLLAWVLSKDHVAVIPKATSRRHIEENLAALDCDLRPEQLDRLDSIADRKRYIDPDPAPWNR